MKIITAKDEIDVNETNHIRKIYRNIQTAHGFQWQKNVENDAFEMLTHDSNNDEFCNDFQKQNDLKKRMVKETHWKRRTRHWKIPKIISSFVLWNDMNHVVKSYKIIGSRM